MRIIIADDHELFRRGVVQLLAGEFEGAEILEANDLHGALALIAQAPDVDICVMDLNMPGVDGAESIATLCDLAPDAKVVVLSASEDRLDVLDVLSAGIDGYIRKSLPSAEIVQSLRDVLDGRVCVPVSLMRRHGRNGASLTETRDGAGLSSMTARQRDVLEHLMLGKSSKEIGRALGLAEGTVKIHLSAIYRALGARSRGEAIAKVAGAR